MAPVGGKALRGSVRERLCDVMEYISQRGYGPTLLYCTSPAKANEYAIILAGGQEDRTIGDKEYQIFLDHIKRAYDIKGSIQHWSFWNVLQKGFAMHHGKLPKYIQKEVLELFNRGVFELLFCTSTIVEGVNTNAKNMVILNHTKGSSSLTAFDLKNIIGRAGRYYHNFIGRYFYFDKELPGIAKNENLCLDFVTYGVRKLEAVDLDNADMSDLTQGNQQAKALRQEQQRKYCLPEEIFIKNRLVKKEAQETLLCYLLEKEEEFEAFFAYAIRANIVEQFTKYAALNTVLKIFKGAGLLDEGIVKRYSAISISYTKDGFQGVLRYQIREAQKGSIPYDRAYANAFNTQRDIIEYKIPKLLALFESIFVCAAEKRGRKLSGFSLSRVVRFYETGVRSYFGEQLVEFGFPLDTIRKMEQKFPQLLHLDSGGVLAFIRGRGRAFAELLDEYERQLLNKALRSFN